MKWIISIILMLVLVTSSSVKVVDREYDFKNLHYQARKLDNGFIAEKQYADSIALKADSVVSVVPESEKPKYRRIKKLLKSIK